MNVMTPAKTPTHVNGYDLARIRQIVDAIRQDPGEARIEFKVRSAWKGQSRSESVIEGYRLGGREIERSFCISADEPVELDGSNIAPNPQELLMAALNACMIVGYTATAAVKGIALDRVEIETEGALDLRGFLGLDPTVPAGYERLRVKVRISGEGSPEQFREIHAAVQATSPNLFNLTRAIKVVPELVVS